MNYYKLLLLASLVYPVNRLVCMEGVDFHTDGAKHAYTVATHPTTVQLALFVIGTTLGTAINHYGPEINIPLPSLPRKDFLKKLPRLGKKA
jgi:hypothetical protein